jgi:SAM-dependent methyltransferase
VSGACYPIERRPGEIERLRAQAAAIAFDAGLMLDRIGVGPGWRCLDLGCGPGGILELLGARVGPTGQAVGLDADPVMLAAARDWTRAHGLTGAGLVASDAHQPGVRREAFDLVHVRFLASTAGRGEELLGAAMALVRPGGVLAFQEPDIETLNCYPAHPAWERLKGLLQAAFERAGGDTRIGQRLYRLLRRAGLEEVRYRPFLVGVVPGEPMTDYLPATVESIRATVLGAALIGEAELDEVLAACRSHLADPDTVFTTYLVVQAWGRKAGQPHAGAAQPGA